MQREREQGYPNLLLQIVFDVCLICIYKVFDKMVARDSNFNFGFKLGGFARHILGSVWLVGLVKGHWFGLVLKMGDLHI